MKTYWIMTWITLVFGITFSMLYNFFTGSFMGFLAYVPWIISISYAAGREK